jgi:exodeoxyribonuclease III
MSRTTLYSWNVNGIRAVTRKGTLEQFVEQSAPDVLCLQEVKAQKQDWDGHFEGYHEYWNSAEKKGYSGTAIFSKTEPLEVRLGFSDAVMGAFDFPDAYGDPTKEGRVTSARYRDFWVVTVYTPNSKDKLERLHLRHQVWDPAFLMHCQELEKEAPVIYTGDFNVAHEPIDLARPKENIGKHGYTTEERDGFGLMTKAGFVDTYRLLHPTQTEAYTWWTNWGGARERNVGWRIDYVMVSAALRGHVAAADIHPGVLGSDHCPVSVTLEL